MEEERRRILKVDAPIGQKHVAIKPQSEKLEELIYDFLKLARERGRCITEPTLKLLAIEEAKVLGIEKFRASDGWLSKFKSSHGIKAKTISDEGKTVDTDLVVSWKSEFPTILSDYDPLNVFNCDETGLFLRLRRIAVSYFLETMDMETRSSKTELLLFCVVEWQGRS